MPHLIIEHSNNLPDKYNPQEFLSALHATISTFEGFPISNLKSRILSHANYLIGNGAQDNVFIHISFSILPGRSPEIKNLLADTLFAAAKEYFPLTLSSCHHSFTLEIKELDRDTYRKESNLIN